MNADTPCVTDYTTRQQDIASAEYIRLSGAGMERLQALEARLGRLADEFRAEQALVREALQDMLRRGVS